MNPKERVYASIRRRRVDRVPRFVWFHPDPLEEFGRRFSTSGLATEAALGNDVLNPLQPCTADMDNAAIKKQSGSALTFMAGLDTQDFLRTATPQEVRDLTRKTVGVMGEGGRFIFAASHTIQPDVPMGNIEAMLEALEP